MAQPPLGPHNAPAPPGGSSLLTGMPPMAPASGAGQPVQAAQQRPSVLGSLKMVCVCVYMCLVAQSRLTLCNPLDCSPPGSSVLGDSPGKNSGVGCHALLQAVCMHLYIHTCMKVKVAQSCPTLCDPMDCIVSRILQARILEWAAFPFSRESSQPRNRTQVSCIVGRFFTTWATREAHTSVYLHTNIHVYTHTYTSTHIHICCRFCFSGLSTEKKSQVGSW